MKFTQITEFRTRTIAKNSVLELLHSSKVISRKNSSDRKIPEFSTLCVDYSLEVSAMKNLSKFPAKKNLFSRWEGLSKTSMMAIMTTIVWQFVWSSETRCVKFVNLRFDHCANPIFEWLTTLVYCCEIVVDIFFFAKKNFVIIIVIVVVFIIKVNFCKMNERIATSCNSLINS